jgi:hypothetical protein
MVEQIQVSHNFTSTYDQATCAVKRNQALIDKQLNCILKEVAQAA